MTWIVYRSRANAALLTLRPRVDGRWVGPPILCVSTGSVRRNAPCGSKLYRLPGRTEA